MRPASPPTSLSLFLQQTSHDFSSLLEHTTETSAGGSSPRFVMNGCSAACWMVMRADGSITTSRFTKSMKSASTSVSYASPRRPATTPNSIDVFAVRTARIARTRAFHEMSFDAQPPGCFSSGISRVTGGGHSKSPFSLNIDAFTGSSAFSMHCGIFPSSFVMSATPHDPPPPPPKCSRFPKKWRCVWKSGLPQPSS